MKVTFNYKMYRWAAIGTWLFSGIGFIIAMSLPLEDASYIGYIIGLGASICMLGFSAIGLVWEMKGWFKKVDKDEKATS